MPKSKKLRSVNRRRRHKIKLKLAKVISRIVIKSNEQKKNKPEHSNHIGIRDRKQEKH